MPNATVTSKGQITIPKAVREVLGVEPGDRIAFRVQEDGAVMMETETVDLLSLRERMIPERGGVGIAEMDRVIRRAADGE